MEQPEAADLALGRAIVARIAPEELPYFDETAASLPKRPGRRARRRVEDDPLAFGGAAELIVTSIACGVATEVVKMMGETVGSGLVARLRRLLTRGRGEEQTAPDAEQQRPALTEERIAELGAAAGRKAVLLGLPPDRAELLAEAVRDQLRAADRPGSGT
ncbi:hypothetical protein C3489_06235 [Streptomyces sp. Ru71]|uniref:hypothetical protein n=1 Tax=Streptomyces sp. Ru71 TaxID=2080746 RepID=UPI000CDDE42C|nr:hypothetical protein [Streptomyces sp. Ru71]POX56314.1 hypothetical protein C3489_06235 [Streptomyces sp. Ru71]